MAEVLVAEQYNSNLKAFTLNAISAAAKINEDVHVLVAGCGCESVSKEAASTVSYTHLTLPTTPYV